ncbi:MAG: peptide-methionine (R)-S-oxide reductase MsrB, partial [Alphaproteobacteria bacterium]|nr:peptide-methionine (R)-S-oxide reductase MsrB [Alphaproteobacteria bacterium]
MTKKVLWGIFLMSALLAGGIRAYGAADQNREETVMKHPLTEMEKYVTGENGTEPAFHNAYWDNHAAGIYVDVRTGKPLFASTDKFDSGTGWPSFTKPIDPKAIYDVKDTSHGMRREEVRSVSSNGHLGHVFDDGPADKGGLRYCINSAALHFIPKDKMQEEGYGQYLPLLDKPER